MSIRKFLFATSAAALLSGAAWADGGPVPEAPPPPPPPPPPADEEPYTPPPPVETAAENVWYAAVFGGAVWLDDMEFESLGDDLFVTDMDTGWAAGGAFGYRYGNGFRAEFEGAWRDNDGLISGDEDVADAKISALSLMLNGLYDFDMGGVSPYIGAGVGAARVDADFDEGSETDDGWAFAYQFIGGVSVPMPNTAIEFFADYRYFSTAGLELDFDGDVQDNDEYRAHTVLGGVRFNF